MDKTTRSVSSGRVGKTDPKYSPTTDTHCPSTGRPRLEDRCVWGGGGGGVGVKGHSPSTSLGNTVCMGDKFYQDKFISKIMQR